MDPATLAWYDQQGAATAARYETVQSPLAGYFSDLLPVGSTVLDIGCGSGRDLAWLLSAGYDAWGVDPSPAMLAQATAFHPDLKARLSLGGLPETGLPPSRTFDAVICMASLMHIPMALLPDAARSLGCLVKPGACLLVSVPSQRPGLDSDYREPGGRLFTPLSVAFLQDVLAEQGFAVQKTFVSNDALARDGVQWVTVLFNKARHSTGFA